MNAPLVTIISPTYNHESYIAECIQSVLRQHYTNWEMIIVDDGSTDRTAIIANSFAQKDQRIQVYSRSNVGIFRLSETYNFALSVSKGDYITVLECDDVWVETKLINQVKAMESRPESVLCWGQAYCSTVDLKENYQLLPLGDQSSDVYNNDPIYSATRVLITSCFIPALTVMVRRSALLQIGGFHQKYNLPTVDMPTWQQLSLYGTFVYLPEILGHWRVNSNQVTKTLTIQLAEGVQKLAEEFFEQCKPLGIFSESDYLQIERYFKKMKVVSYSRSGRYKLIRRDFTGARKDYLRSIFSFGWYEPVWKLRSVVGLIFSLFNADIEGLTRLMGRISYK